MPSEKIRRNSWWTLSALTLCLMATVDTAYTFSDIGKYLVASQEVEPGNGWLYSGWLGALGQTPDMEPMELAKVICDSYAQGCEEVGTEDNITLSVTDLSKVSDLVAAYDDFGKEALAKAIEDPVIYHDVCHVGQSRQCCLLRCCNLLNRQAEKSIPVWSEISAAYHRYPQRAGVSLPPVSRSESKVTPVTRRIFYV
ncbi:MAG: clostripain-related cysteine peptidase [Acetivibrionales bacterium]